jgi:hypothetical protein
MEDGGGIFLPTAKRLHLKAQGRAAHPASNKRKGPIPKGFISTVGSDWQANSVPPPQPPEEEAQAILPSTFIQCWAIDSFQKRFIFQARVP